MQCDTPKSPECLCFAGDVFCDNFDARALGEDSRGGEVTVLRCKRCGQFWLDYLMEYPHLTAAGRWIHGPITPEMAAYASAEAAREILEKQAWYFRGGSAFDGTITRTVAGHLDLWLSVSAPSSSGGNNYDRG
jgi:hypothetical protein